MTGMITLSILCAACAVFLWHIADMRGLNTRFWAIMGAVFGPLAIPFVFMTKNKVSEADLRDEE